jgi:hypothetical protein
MSNRLDIFVAAVKMNDFIASQPMNGREKSPISHTRRNLELLQANFHFRVDSWEYIDSHHHEDARLVQRVDINRPGNGQQFGQ